MLLSSTHTWTVTVRTPCTSSGVSQQVDNSEALQDDPDFAVALENIQLQGLHFSCGDVLQRLWVGIYTAIHFIPDAVVLDECGGRLQLFGVEVL